MERRKAEDGTNGRVKSKIDRAESIFHCRRAIFNLRECPSTGYPITFSFHDRSRCLCFSPPRRITLDNFALCNSRLRNTAFRGIEPNTARHSGKRKKASRPSVEKHISQGNRSFSFFLSFFFLPTKIQMKFADEKRIFLFLFFFFFSLLSTVRVFEILDSPAFDRGTQTSDTNHLRRSG